MKKDIVAAALLAVLFIGSLFNIAYLDRLTGRIEDELTASIEKLEEGDAAQAREHLIRALDMWLAADGYTHIFIRHPEIDSTSDAFYDLAKEIGKNDAESCRPAYEMLLYHLSSIRTMEHLRFGSIM